MHAIIKKIFSFEASSNKSARANTIFNPILLLVGFLFLIIFSKPTMKIENAINISTILISTVMILADPRNNVAECPIVKPVIA